MSHVVVGVNRVGEATRVPSRVRRSLLADQVFDVLRRRIARGDWAPGEHLRMRDVAASVGTSEMPVREAFRRLAQAGLIELEPYKGATVRTLRIRELEHTYDVRIMLEAEAGRQGALSADDAVVVTMRRHWALVQESAERGDLVEAVAEDENVLSALYDSGDNDVLVGMVRSLWDSCRPYKSLWVSHAIEQGMETWTHIPELIEAATVNDGERAFRILQRTYTDARATVRQLLDRQTGEER